MMIVCWSLGVWGTTVQGVNRVPFLKDIYTTTRMIGDDPGPERVQISREQGHHEPVDQLDEWIKEIHIFFTESTVQPRRDIISYADLVARPKVSSDPRNPLTSVECRNKESPTKPPRVVKSTRQETWKQLGDTGPKIEALPLATDAITRAEASARMHTGLHVTGTNDTTQEENHIFVWKDIGGKMPSDSSRRLDASMQPQTPSNGSDIGSTSTGIDGVRMSEYSEDSDGPMTGSSEIVSVSLSDSSIGSRPPQSAETRNQVPRHMKTR